MPRGGGLTQQHKVSNDMAAIIGTSKFQFKILPLGANHQMYFKIFIIMKGIIRVRDVNKKSFEDNM